MLSSSPPWQGATASAARSGMSFFMYRRIRVHFFTRCCDECGVPAPVDRFLRSAASQSPARGDIGAPAAVRGDVAAALAQPRFAEHAEHFGSVVERNLADA